MLKHLKPAALAIAALAALSGMAEATTALRNNPGLNNALHAALQLSPKQAQ